MRFTPTDITGLWLIDLEQVGDERGWFARSWCGNELESRGLCGRFVQGNISFNEHCGTLRGMHYQAPPHEEVKVVRVVRGAVHDVVIDLRPDSPTYLRSRGFDLTHTNLRALYIPVGLAHGFVTLKDHTEVHYLMSEAYHPESARGVRWNDPAFAVNWPEVDIRRISDKDRQYPDFKP